MELAIPPRISLHMKIEKITQIIHKTNLFQFRDEFLSLILLLNGQLKNSFVISIRILVVQISWDLLCSLQTLDEFVQVVFIKAVQQQFLNENYDVVYFKPFRLNFLLYFIYHNLKCSPLCTNYVRMTVINDIMYLVLYIFTFQITYSNLFFTHLVRYYILISIFGLHVHTRYFLLSMCILYILCSVYAHVLKQNLRPRQLNEMPFSGQIYSTRYSEQTGEWICFLIIDLYLTLI